MTKAYIALVDHALEQGMEIRVVDIEIGGDKILDWSADRNEILKALRSEPETMLVIHNKVNHQALGWAQIKAFVKDELTVGEYSLFPGIHPHMGKGLGFIDDWHNENAHLFPGSWSASA